MRLRFFLWASADLGVRFSNVSISLRNASYTMFESFRGREELLQKTQQCRSANGQCAPAVILEEILQRELDQARIACALHPPEVYAIAAVSVRIGTLRMVEHVEELRP